MKVHELRSWPEYFAPVWEGVKTVEIRQDDRGFSIGDLIWLREWDPKIEVTPPIAPDDDRRYTGRDLLVRVRHITYDHPGLVKSYVALSVEYVRLVPVPAAEYRLNEILRYGLPSNRTAKDEVAEPAQ